MFSEESAEAGSHDGTGKARLTTLGDERPLFSVHVKRSASCGYWAVFLLAGMT